MSAAGGDGQGHLRRVTPANGGQTDGDVRAATPRSPPSANRLAVVVAGLIVAGTIHLAVAFFHGTHTEVFAVVGAAQLATGIAVVKRPSRRTLGAAGLLSAGIVAAWMGSRAGIGFAGQPIGLLDTVAASAATSTVVVAAALIRTRSRGWPTSRSALLAIGVAMPLALAVVLVAPAAGHHQEHHEPTDSDARTIPARNVFGDLFDHHSFDKPHDSDHSH